MRRKEARRANLRVEERRAATVRVAERDTVGSTIASDDGRGVPRLFRFSCSRQQTRANFLVF